jgi:hypothetical protein
VKVTNVRPVLRSEVIQLVEDWEGRNASKQHAHPLTSTPNQAEAIVENLLQGIDTESLFQDF